MAKLNDMGNALEEILKQKGINDLTRRDILFAFKTSDKVKKLFEEQALPFNVDNLEQAILQTRRAQNANEQARRILAIFGKS